MVQCSHHKAHVCVMPITCLINVDKCLLCKLYVMQTCNTNIEMWK